jgi:hypothetical protein
MVGISSLSISRYSKFIASLLLSAATIVQTYPNVDWKQALTAGIGTALVWLVPNSAPFSPVTVKTTAMPPE